MRKLEKISFEQFKKDIKNDKKLYEEYNIPKRATKTSAGYDFEVLEDYIIKPGEMIKIPTGIKVCMEPTDAFFLFVRSSMGFKYNIRLCNQVGIVDSDYYNNSNNEGHMWIKIQNEGTEVVTLTKGQRFAQGVFIEYKTVDDEEEIKRKRTGATGSTDKEE